MEVIIAIVAGAAMLGAVGWIFYKAQLGGGVGGDAGHDAPTERVLRAEVVVARETSG